MLMEMISGFQVYPKSQETKHVKQVSYLSYLGLALVQLHSHTTATNHKRALENRPPALAPCIPRRYKLSIYALDEST